MITATCNPNWPELKEQLLPGQSATEAPHITNRVFKVCRFSFSPMLAHSRLNLPRFRPVGSPRKADESDQGDLRAGLPHLCNRVPKARSSSCTYCCEGSHPCILRTQRSLFDVPTCSCAANCASKISTP
jgi:hypothetical protein